MFSINTAVFAFALLHIAPIGEAKPLLNSTNVTDVNIQALTFVGTVEGKSYFADTIKRTWFQADQLCRQSNLRLGSIRTSAQGRFLKDALGRQFHNEPLWTAGKESRSSQSIFWDGTSINPNPSYVDVFQYYPANSPSHYCQLLYSNAINNVLVLEVRLCGTDYFGVLCES